MKVQKIEEEKRELFIQKYREYIEKENSLLDAAIAILNNGEEQKVRKPVKVYQKKK